MIVLSEYTNKDKKMATDSKYLDNTNSYKSSTIYNDIASAEEENNPLKKLEEFTRKRINLRKAVSNWEMNVWNKEWAEKTNRIAAINDLYRWLLASQTNADWTPVYNIDKLSDPTYSWYIKDPEFYEMIKYEIWNSNNASSKLSALENYVEKWWYPTKVFDYLTSTDWKKWNIYWIDEQALREKTWKWRWINKEEVEKAKAEDHSAYSSSDIAAARFLSKPLETALWLWSLWAKYLNKSWLSDWIRNKQYSEWDKASTEEYNQYKKWTLWKESWAYKDPLISWAKELSREDLYKAYDSAKKNWFEWSVEEYANYTKDMDKYITDIKFNTQKHLIDEDLIETNKSAIVADVAWEIVETIMMERWLKWLWIFSKWVEWVKNLSKASRLSSLKNVLKERGIEMGKSISNLLVDTLRWSTEVLTLEAAKSWELPTKEESGSTTAVVWWLEALLRIPWAAKFLKDSFSDAVQAIYKIPESAYESISTQTAKEWANKLNVSEGSFWLHPKTTPKQELWTMWNDAARNLKKDLRWQEQELKWLRQNIKWTTKPEDIIKPIETEWWLNQAMTKLSDMWDLSIKPDKVPVFDINENGVMSIHNKESLNAYAKDWKWLWDAIEELWNWMFANWTMEQNAATADAFVSDLEKLIYDYDLSWSTKSNSLKDVFVRWIKDAKKVIRWWIDDASKTALEEAEKKYAKTRQLDNAVEAYITKSWSKWDLIPALKETEIGKNVWEWWDVIRIIAEELKWWNYSKKDLAAETVAYAYALALKDPKAAAALIEEMYPSIPWLREYFLQSFRRKALERTSKQIVKDAWLEKPVEELWWVWKNIKWAVEKVPALWWLATTRSRWKKENDMWEEDIWEEIDLYDY